MQQMIDLHANKKALNIERLLICNPKMVRGWIIGGTNFILA